MYILQLGLNNSRNQLQRGLITSIFRSFSTDFSNPFEDISNSKFRKPLKVKSHGIDIINNPLYNKGTSFSDGERDRLGLRGLVPPRQLTFEQQQAKVLMNLRKLQTDIEKSQYLQDLHNRNETLFHRILIDHIEEIAPYVYTPTVGRVCQEFGHNFRRPRGMYFSTRDRGHMHAMMYNWPQKEVHVIVVTDGSRILGLGDLGAHGMGIPIGKLALYCAAGGIAPHRVLPVMLDCGTNNENLLKDEFYIGVRHRRIVGEEFDEMVDEFLHAVFSRFPEAVVQFEDFSSDKAFRILNKYRNVYRCFNDDIQGTGAVTLAGVLSALKQKGLDPSKTLKDQKILVAGAGSAGLGVCDQLMEGMIQQGLTREEARNNFYIVSSKGLIGQPNNIYENGNIQRGLTDDRKPWVRPDMPDGMPLIEVAKAVRPTILLGLAATGHLFTEELVTTIYEYEKQPIIFPLSNPTSVAECTFEQAMNWTQGNVIFASGSPFRPMVYNNRNNKPSQCNNMYVFPGIGLGASLSGTRIITDRMLYKVSEALSYSVTEEERENGLIFPDISRIRQVSQRVALAVIETAIEQNLDTKLSVEAKFDLPGYIQKKMYDPVYVPLVDDIYR